MKFEPGDIVVRETPRHVRENNEVFIWLGQDMNQGFRGIIVIGSFITNYSGKIKYLNYDEWKNIRSIGVLPNEEWDRLPKPDEKKMIMSAIHESRQMKYVLMRKIFGEKNKPRKYY